jgi:hypothetical protein
MVEAERVDVSLKENDVKNRRSLPIPNHSFPRMTPQPPERTPPTHLVAATEGVCLVRSCRNDAFFCDLASDRLYSWKNGLAPTSQVSVVRQGATPDVCEMAPKTRKATPPGRLHRYRKNRWSRGSQHPILAAGRTSRSANVALRRQMSSCFAGKKIEKDNLV